MSKEIMLSVPSPYDKFITDSDLEIHKEFASKSVSEFEDEMVEYSVFETNAGTGLRYIDLRHPDGDESDKAVIVPFPFGTDYSVEQHIRWSLLQELLPEPTRLLLFPNDTVENPDNYKLKNMQCGYSSDAIHRLGNTIVSATKNAGIEKAVIVGWSQGADSGAAALAKNEDRLDLTSGAVLGDPAGTIERTPKKLTKAFIKSGLKDFNKAVNDSGIPALSEALYTRGGLDAVKGLMSWINVLKSSRIAENRLLHDSMTRGKFWRDIDEAILLGTITDPANVLMVRAEHSTVTPVKSINRAEELGLQTETVGGYGHGAGDHAVLLSLLARKAFVGSGFLKT